MSDSTTWRDTRFELPGGAAPSRKLIDAVKLHAVELIRGLKGPPFDLESELVQRTAAIGAIRPSRDISADGRIFWDPSGYVIQLKSTLDPSRRAFTLGHEIAHTFFFNCDRGVSQRTDPTTETFSEQKPEEYLCDVAAAEMLMPAAALIDPRRFSTPETMARPENSFLRRVISYRPSAKSLVALAREFRTSLSATAWRFVQMGMWSCHVGFWNSGGDKHPSFVSGYASRSLNLRISRGYEAHERSIVSCAARERHVVQGWSDIGLLSVAGEPQGKAFVQALPMRGGRLITMAVFEPAPEHLVAAFDRRQSTGPRQAAFPLISRK
jgi:uncharacterized protein DUF955